MDLPGAKGYAKDKWRAGRSGRRGGGRHGRGGGPGLGEPQKSELEQPEMSDEEHSDTGSGVDEGPVAVSAGMDLEQLLAEVRLQYERAFHRFYGIQEALMEEQAPTGSVAAGQELGIDMAQLAASLAALPLDELLGVPAEYLEEVTEADLLALGVQPALTQPGALTHQPTQRPVAAVAPSAPKVDAQTKPVALQPAVSTSKPAPVAATAPTAAAQHQQQPDDFLDDLLGAPTTIGAPAGLPYKATHATTLAGSSQPKGGSSTAQPPSTRPEEMKLGQSLEDWLGI